MGARLVGRVPDLAPVPRGRVRGRDQLVVLVLCPVLDLHEVPAAVVQACAERAVELGRQLGGRGRGRHGDLLRGGVRIGVGGGEDAEPVEGPLEPRRPGLEPRALVAQDRGPGAGLVGVQEGADGRQRQLEVPERGDGPRRRDLVAPVAPVAGRRVHVGGRQDALLVVVPEGADREPGQPREAPDRQQVVVHVRIVNPRPTRESRPNLVRMLASRSPCSIHVHLQAIVQHWTSVHALGQRHAHALIRSGRMVVERTGPQGFWPRKPTQ